MAMQRAMAATVRWWSEPGITILTLSVHGITTQVGGATLAATQ